MDKAISLTGLCLLGFILLGNAFLTTAAEKTVIPSEKSKADHGLDKREWSDMKSAWGKRSGEMEDGILDDLQLQDIPSRSIREAAGWRDGMRAAWGKRDRDGSGWTSGLKAWGKRGAWSQNLRAWGKRTPAEWTDEYVRSLQRQMDAVKNRRASNWQLASWGK